MFQEVLIPQDLGGEGGGREAMGGGGDNVS